MSPLSSWYGRVTEWRSLQKREHSQLVEENEGLKLSIRGLEKLAQVQKEDIAALSEDLMMASAASRGCTEQSGSGTEGMKAEAFPQNRIHLLQKWRSWVCCRHIFRIA